MNLVSFRDFLKALSCLLLELNEIPSRIIHLPLWHFVVSPPCQHPVS